MLFRSTHTQHEQCEWGMGLEGNTEAFDGASCMSGRSESSSDVSTFWFITMEKGTKGKLAVVVVVADNHVLSHDYGMTLLI